MQSVSALDLVSGALKSTLARAQKSYDFNTLSTKGKRKNNKLDGEGLIIEPDSGKEKDFSYWNIAVKSNKLQFATSGYQLSTFIKTIRSKYECLNPTESGDGLRETDPLKLRSLKPKQLVCNKLKNKSKSSDCDVKNIKYDPVRNGKNHKLYNKLSKTHLEDSTPKIANPDQKLLGKTGELFEQLKERRKEARRRKKEARKLARLEKLKAIEPNLFSSDIFGKTSKNNLSLKNLHPLTNRQISSKNRIMKETSVNSENVVNGLGTSNTNQLSQPRVVLYARDKVVPGWKDKYPVGCGLINLGNSCYMNASLQALFHTPAFVNWLLDDSEHKLNCRNAGQFFQSCIICAMYNTLKESHRNNHCLRPLQIHNKLKVICKHFTHGRQEDAHEFLRYLLESMERSYLAAINSLRLDNRSKETTPLGQIFGGYLRTEVTCLKCNFISTTFQPLAELQLDIRHVTTLEDAVQNHFKKERLDNNDYKCEKCHTISQATKQFSLEIPPIVLCLQLKRFTLYGNKITKPIHCNRSLNLTRYLHKQKNQEIGQGDIKYRLVALVTHMGSSPNCGHYTAIAEASNGHFYQFDDSFVRQVSVQTALNTDAYVIIYEMDRSQNQNSVSTSMYNANCIERPSTVTNPLQTTMSSNSFNGSGIRLGSPLPSSKRVTVPFLKSPASENSALRNATMGSPSVPNTASKISSTNSLSTSSKLLSNSTPRFEWNNLAKSPTNKLITPTLVDQQYGVKRKMDEVLEKKDTAQNESKQPRLLPSNLTSRSTHLSVSPIKTNGIVDKPVSSTSSWKVITNGISIGSLEKPSENIRKCLSKSGGYSSDPETKQNDISSRQVDFHRSKSEEKRQFHSQPIKTDVSFKNHSGNNSILAKSPEKLRKNSSLDVNSKSDTYALIGSTKTRDDHPVVNMYTNGHAKTNDRKECCDHISIPKPRPESSNSILLGNKSTGSSCSESSSDERRKSKSNKHKKKAKRNKGKRKKKKHHKRSSTSSSSNSASESESESSGLLKKQQTSAALKMYDLLRSRKNNKTHKSKHESRSPQTTSTDLSEDGNRKQSKYNDNSRSKSEEISSEITRSMSEERERDRRKNRNPSRSRSPDKKDAFEGHEKFDASKIVTREKQIVSWNGTESTLSKSIDVDRKYVRKSKNDIFDEEMDIGRVKKSRKSRSPSRDNENGSSCGNKFQNYEERKRTVSQWTNKLTAGVDNSKEHKYSEKGDVKAGGENPRHVYRENKIFGSGYAGSYNLYHSYRNNSQFRNGKGGRSNFRQEDKGIRIPHHTSFRRENRERRPS